MKYFLGELYITHKKTIFGWMPFTHKATTILIEAYSWEQAYIKAQDWAADWINKTGGKERKKYRYNVFATPSI